MLQFTGSQTVGHDLVTKQQEEKIQHGRKNTNKQHKKENINNENVGVILACNHFPFTKEKLPHIHLKL